MSEDHHQTKPEDRVPIGRKLAVGAGGLIVQYMVRLIWRRIFVLLVCGVSVSPVSAVTWQRNTFPGQGHVDNGYVPGYGWDHIENPRDLSVSPIDPDWQIVVDNEWGALVTENGRNFQPLHMPHIGTRQCAVQSAEFSQYDADTAYLLISHEYWTNCPASPAGLWRTEDKGESWTQIYTPPSESYERYGNNPGKRHFVEDPCGVRSNCLYFGTTSDGIVRSTDGGTNWSEVLIENTSLVTDFTATEGYSNGFLAGQADWGDGWDDSLKVDSSAGVVTNFEFSLAGHRVYYAAPLTAQSGRTCRVEAVLQFEQDDPGSVIGAVPIFGIELLDDSNKSADSFRLELKRTRQNEYYNIALSGSAYRETGRSGDYWTGITDTQLGFSGYGSISGELTLTLDVTYLGGTDWRADVSLYNGTAEVKAGTALFTNTSSFAIGNLYAAVTPASASSGYISDMQMDTFEYSRIPVDTDSALTDRCIKTIAAGTYGADQTVLYAIAGKKMPRQLEGDMVPLDYPAPTDYLADWCFEQNLQDSSANDRDLSGTVSSWEQSCAQGSYAAGFNGSSTHLAIGNLSYSNASLSTLTVMGWVKTASTADQTVISFDRDQNWELGINEDGQIRWSIHGTNGVTYEVLSTDPVNDGDWHHIAGVYSWGWLYIYIDGQQTDSYRAGAWMLGSSVRRYGFLGISSESETYGDDQTLGSSYFNGSMDDVRIYHRVLSHHIAGIYLAGAAKNPVAQGPLWRIRVGAAGEISEITRVHPGIDDFCDLEVNPEDPSCGWLIRKGMPGGSIGGRELVRFSDWGETLSVSTATLGSSSAFAQVLINPANTNHVVLLCTGWLKSGLRYSTDGGTTWQAESRPVQDGHIPSLQSWLPRDYANYGLGIEDGTWHEPLGNPFSFVSGATSELLWVNSFRGGLMKSTDSGATFTTWASGGPNKDLCQVATAPSDPDCWITCSYEYGYPSTTNNGLSWRGSTYENDDTLGDLTVQATAAGSWWTACRTASGVAYNPTNANELFGLWTYKGYIVHSLDGGLSWSDTGCRSPVDQFAGVYWSTVDADRLYAGRMVSTNGGTDWYDIGKFVLAMSSSNPDILVGVTDIQRNVTEEDLMMYISVDGGVSWTVLPDPPSEAVPGLSGTTWSVTSTSRTGGLAGQLVAIDPSSDHDPSVSAANRIRVLLAGRSGIYEYNAANVDGSGSPANWQVRTSGLEANSHYSLSNPVPWMGFVIFDPRPGHEQTVYAAKTMDAFSLREWSGELNANHAYPGGDNYEPFYCSTNGGVSWQKLHGSGYPNAPVSAMIHSMTVDNAGRLLAATGEGVYIFAGDEAAQDDYSAWQALYNWSRPEDADALADPDQDGDPNFLEYAVGNDPLDADGVFRANMTVTGNTVNYSFFRASSFISYSLLQSTNLVDWTESLVPSGPDGTVINYSFPQECDQLFLRLKIGKN